MPTGRMMFQVKGSIRTPAAPHMVTHWSTKKPAYLNQNSMPRLNTSDTPSQALRLPSPSSLSSRSPTK